jgi:Zn-dependent protease
VPSLTPEQIALAITSYIVLLFSLSVHESAHAWMALRMGDDTAASLGRITLNPLVHIDPVGTVLMPILQVFASGLPLLAWAKPTPVQPRNFKPGYFRRGQILVAGAGPVSNLLLALLFTGLFVVAVRAGLDPDARGPLPTLLSIGVKLNVVLGVFNLLPVPPLDGSWIASWGLPRTLAAHYDAIMEPYGQWILLILLATGALGEIIWPIVSVVQGLLFSLIR